MQKILNLCPTGTQSTKANSRAPIFANEIIDDVLSCAETGITLVHLHARDIEGNNTWKKEYYQQIISGIQKYCADLLIGVSLSGRYFSDRNLRTEVLCLQPDFASLTMSSLNFPTSASVNDPETITWLIEEMKKYGVLPEIECFDSGMLNYTNFLVKKNILPEPLYVNLILGNIFNAGTEPSSIANLKNHFPENSKVCFGGIGKEQLKANVLGLIEADGVRTGLEDNFYYRGKEKATNKELIQRIHRIAAELEYEIMSSADLRALGYGNKNA